MGFGRSNCRTRVAARILAAAVLLLACSATLHAKPVGAKEARRMVQGWLKKDAKPLGAKLGDKVDRSETFADANGLELYHVVYLERDGFVIVPADDMVEPIIAFVEQGTYRASADNPLGALVSRDLPERLAAARELQKGTKGKKIKNRQALERAAAKAKSKWELLAGSDETIAPLGFSSISEVWVPPFVQSKWGQTTVQNIIGWPACYNYYTPPGPDGSSSNYPCGCVGTAVAQLIRYDEYPGWYTWSNMPDDPDYDTPASQRQEIGELCFDAAEAANTSYASGGSSGYLYYADINLVNTFGYSNSIHIDYPSIGSVLNTMTNPNLDAAHPVLLGLNGPWGRHAVVCDGYGRNASTLYHHLNLGWCGNNDAWYNLPTVDSSPYSFNVVDECVYNVFISGSGEIISGRVTDPGGSGVSDVNITASGGGTYYAMTNDNGIYALLNVPSNTSFTVSASKDKWSFTNQPASTGRSQDGGSTSGNDWGVNFVGTTEAGFVEFVEDVYAVGDSVGIRLVDDDLTGAGSYDVAVMVCGGDYETVTLSESPASSGAFGGSVSMVQGTIIQEDGTVQVQSNKPLICLYNDDDDGSGAAAVSTDTADIYPVSEDFTGGIGAGWTIVDGYTDGETWRAANEGEYSTKPNWDETLTGEFFIVDSDFTPPANMDEQLITPTFDCSSYGTVTLSFRHQFVYNAGEYGDVDIKVDGGGWQNILRYQSSTSGDVEVDITAIAAGHSAVQVRWYYHNAYYDWYWGIDNVLIAGVSESVSVKGDLEPDCDVDFADFARFGQGWLSTEGGSNWNEACNLAEPGDTVINALDLAVLVQNWLSQP